MSRRQVLRAAGLAAVGLGVLPVMSGCGDERPTLEVAASSRARRQVGDAAAGPAAAAVRDFGADLYRSVAQGTPGNLAVSPWSVALALDMVRGGAVGRTADEIDQVLHAPDHEALETGLNSLTRLLESRSMTRKRHDGSTADVRLEIASSVWGQRGVTWQPRFLDALAENFGAGLQLADFVADPEAARRAINFWTSERTHERIPELVPPGVLDAGSRLVLVNALWLKAPWAVPFLAHRTRDAPFTRSDGSTVTAAMMTRSADPLPYAEGDGWQAVQLGYEGRGLAMTLLLPAAGRLAELEAALTGERLDRLMSGLARQGVSMSLPRWTFRTQVPLKAVLAALGMPTAFGGSADFSGMTRDEQLRIAAVLHEAFVAVDEEGTEAAAATAVAMRASATIRSVQLTFDRPFLFVIHDVETATPLFVGRVDDPSAA